MSTDGPAIDNEEGGAVCHSSLSHTADCITQKRNDQRQGQKRRKRHSTNYPSGTLVVLCATTRRLRYD